MVQDREYQPLDGYDYQNPKTVMLRDSGGREAVGIYGRKLFEYDENGQLVELTASVMQWGALVDGEFQPMRSSFTPIEFALLSFEDAATLVLV